MSESTEAPGPGADAGTARKAPTWLPWGLVVANLLLAVLAFHELLTFRPRSEEPLDTEGWFFEPSDTSPPVIAILVLWLMMRRWRRFSALPGRPGSYALTGLLLAAGAGVFWWALRVAAPELQALTLFLYLLAFANLLAGRPAMRIALVPAVVLFFAVPMPATLINQVVWTCQIWTANYAGMLLDLMGLDALVSGDQIVRADNVFAIIETCSGLRSVETLTLLAFLMADLFGRRGWHAALLVCIAPPLAFAINGFRVLGLILNPHSDIAVIHNAQGIAMLLVGVLVLYGIDGLLARWLRGPRRRKPSRDASLPAPQLLGRLAGIAGLLVATGWLGWATPAWQLGVPGPYPAAALIPAEFDGWRSQDTKVDWLFLGKAGFRQAVNRNYARSRERAGLFIGIGAPDLRYQSLLSPKTGLPGSGWTLEEESRRRIGDRDVQVRVVRRGSKRLLVHHWYEGTGNLFGESLREAVGLAGSPFRRTSPHLVVRVDTPVGLGSGARRAADRRLVELAEALAAPILALRGEPEAS